MPVSPRKVEEGEAKSAAMDPAPGKIRPSSSGSKLQVLAERAETGFSVRSTIRRHPYSLTVFAFFIVALVPWLGTDSWYEKTELYDSYLGKTEVVMRYRQAKHTREAINEMRAKLEEYYGGTDILTNTNKIPGYNNTIYQQGLEFISEKMARALVWQDQFVIGSIGTSVLAGHDNCNYDSYPRQLERLMKPVWEAAKIKFEVRNGGEGGHCGDNLMNQVWCLRNIAGDDADIVHYSFSYFEAPAAAREGIYQGKDFHEMFMRWSLLMDHSAAPQLIYVGDYSKEAVTREFTLRDRGLIDKYGQYGASTFVMTRALIDSQGQKWQARFGDSLPKWGEVGDGLHNTTREGELLDTSTPEGKARRDSLGVVMRNWHPGPLLFQTISDSLAYHYSSALLLALDKVTKEDPSKIYKRWPKVPRVLNKYMLPSPGPQCPMEWCHVDEAPGCISFEKPTFGHPQMKLLARDAGTNPLGPQAEPAMPWAEWVAPPEQNFNVVPRAELNTDIDEQLGCKHLDFCGAMEKKAGQDAGWITFQLPKMRVGFIAVCCGQGTAVKAGEDKECGKDMLAAGITFKLENRTLPGPYTTVFDKCVQAQAKFEGQSLNTYGHMHISVHFPPTSHQIRLSQVIAL